MLDSAIKMFEAWKTAQQAPDFHVAFEDATGITKEQTTRYFDWWNDKNHAQAAEIAVRNGLTVQDGGFQAFLFEIDLPRKPSARAQRVLDTLAKDTDLRDEVAWFLGGSRIHKALDDAGWGTTDGAHHKMWVIDQMVRALTGCPMEDQTRTDINDSEYHFRWPGESDEYRAWVAELEDGEDGPQTYEWDPGIPP